MNSLRLAIFFSILGLNSSVDNTQILLGQLFKVITNTLTNGAGDLNNTRQYQQQYYRPQNGQQNPNGISSTVYSALQTIAKNDELECVSRLLCEAAAGGKPGSIRQLNIDKQSLTSLLSFLQLDGANSSPMLTFGKAALLGLSNRGNSYECNVNYPKCPRDQERLLYYLNNHQGGFFRFFDMKQPHYQQYQQNQNYQQYQQRPQGTYHYQPDYQNGLHYNINLNQMKPNHQYLIYPNVKNHLYAKYRKRVKPAEVYAKKYDHSSMSFSLKDYERFSRGNKKTIIFPNDRKDVMIEERIQTKIVRVPQVNDYFIFSNSNRGSKNLKYSDELKYTKFFPARDRPDRPAALVTDRLPNMFYFPERERREYGSQMKFPVSYAKQFFPNY